MILDDENILVDSIQKDVDNDLYLIKMVRDQYGTFDHNETHRILNHMFSEILNDETNPYLKSLIESYGWFIFDMNECFITITEHPRKCNGHPSQLFDIIMTDTDKGLVYSIRFYEYSCSLSSQIKSYMVNKYKIIQVGRGLVPERFKHEWILNI